MGQSHSPGDGAWGRAAISGDGAWGSSRSRRRFKPSQAVHKRAESAVTDDELAQVQQVLLKPYPAGKPGSGRMLASKWAKTAALLSHSGIAPHIPPTRLYSEGNLKQMLDQHGMVVIKPVRGTGGLGVIKITRNGTGYSYTSQSRTVFAATLAALFRALKPLQKGRAYLIQKGIHLATVDGRPIDTGLNM